MLVYAFAHVKSENHRLRQLLEKLKLILTRSTMSDSQVISTAATLLALLPRRKKKARKMANQNQLRLALREIA
jgi:hypothetical protein